MKDRSEEVVIQIQFDVQIPKEENTFDFTEKVRAALENAGLEVLGIDIATSWSVKEYYELTGY